MKLIYTLIIVVILLIALTVGGSMWLGNKTTVDCMEASRIRQVNVDGSSWEGPDQKWFDICMNK